MGWAGFWLAPYSLLFSLGSTSFVVPFIGGEKNYVNRGSTYHSMFRRVDQKGHWLLGHSLSSTRSVGCATERRSTTYSREKVDLLLLLIIFLGFASSHITIIIIYLKKSIITTSLPSVFVTSRPLCFDQGSYKVTLECMRYISPTLI